MASAAWDYRARTRESHVRPISISMIPFPRAYTARPLGIASLIYIRTPISAEKLDCGKIARCERVTRHFKGGVKNFVDGGTLASRGT